jgi:hypothetical protein
MTKIEVMKLLVYLNLEVAVWIPEMVKKSNFFLRKYIA